MVSYFDHVKQRYKFAPNDKAAKEREKATYQEALAKGIIKPKQGK